MVRPMGPLAWRHPAPGSRIRVLTVLYGTSRFFPSRIWMIALGAMLASTAALADDQIFKCESPNGQVVYQSFRCEVTNSTSADKTAINADIESTCAPAKLNPREYFRCEAEIQCSRIGAYGDTHITCVRGLRADLEERAEREDAEARRRAAEVASAARRDEERRREAARPRSSPSSNYSVDTTPVNCYALSEYARAKGHGWMERALIVDSAQKQGGCTWNAP